MNLQEWMNSEEGRELAAQIGKRMQDRMRREQDIKRKNFEILNQYAREGAIVFMRRPSTTAGSAAPPQTTSSPPLTP